MLVSAHLKQQSPLQDFTIGLAFVGKDLNCCGCVVACWVRYTAVIGPAPVQGCKRIPVLGGHGNASSGGYVVAPVVVEHNSTVAGVCVCAVVPTLARGPQE